MTATGEPTGADGPGESGGHGHAGHSAAPGHDARGPADEGQTRSERAPAAAGAAPRGAGSVAGTSTGRRLVLDRWEGETAVLEDEDGGTVDLPRWAIPPGAVEGAVVVFRALGDGAEARVEVTLDPAAASAARAEAAAMVERLRKRDPGGDLTL